MGKTLMGGTTRGKNVNLLTPEQQQLYSQLINQVGPQAGSAFSQFLYPKSTEDYQGLFQQTYVNPALQAYNQQILPSIQQRFTDLNAGSSSALNQALAQSAQDLSTSLGSQFGGFLQNQQQQQLQALSQFLPLLTQRNFTPTFQEQQGILGPLIQGGATLGAGLFMSSKKVKENVRPYYSGLEELKKLNVKQYDYIEDVGGQKDKVGLIAEEVPKEFIATKNGIEHVDIYGLVGLVINAIKDLNNKIDSIEERV